MSKSEEIRREILRLESRYDGLPESAVTERRELERRVNELREQLDAPEVPSEPAPNRDLVREAKEHLGTVEDILGTKSPEQERAEKVAALEAERAQERRYLDESRKQPYSRDRADDDRDSLRRIRAIDSEIAEQDPTTAAIDFVNQSAVGAAASESVNKYNRERELENQRHAIAEAAAAVGRGVEVAKQGDLERAVRSTSAEATQAAVDNARASDEMVSRHGCTTPVLAGISIAVVIAIIFVITKLAGNDDAKCAAADGSGEIAASADCVVPATGSADTTATQSEVQTSSADTTAAQSEVPTNGAAPPSEADLPAGVLLFQGRSGGPIGCIACDGQSRFLSLERSGVGVGNLSSAEFETMWELDGQILEFGARLTAPNKGRYGVNLWIDGAIYGPGVALEIGERSAVLQWTPERDGTIHAGHLMSIIVGEAGTVDDFGVPVAQGDYELEWWFTFKRT